MIPLSDIFKNNSAWSATGNEQFFRDLERRAAGVVRIAFLPSNSGAIAAESAIQRTRAAGIVSPLILFARPIRGRSTHFRDDVRCTRGIAGHIVADFPDWATVTTCHYQQSWIIPLRGRPVTR